MRYPWRFCTCNKQLGKESIGLFTVSLDILLHSQWSIATNLATVVVCSWACSKQWLTGFQWVMWLDCLLASHVYTPTRLYKAILWQHTQWGMGRHPAAAPQQQSLQNSQPDSSLKGSSRHPWWLTGLWASHAGQSHPRMRRRLLSGLGSVLQVRRNWTYLVPHPLAFGIIDSKWGFISPQVLSPLINCLGALFVCKS